MSDNKTTDLQSDNNSENMEITQQQSHSRSLEHRTVETVMEDSFLRYSMSVNYRKPLSRAMCMPNTASLSTTVLPG
jgi:hypothetical protein